MACFPQWDFDHAVLELTPVPKAALRAHADGGDVWGEFLDAHGADALPALVHPDPSEAPHMLLLEHRLCGAGDGGPPVALVELAAARAELAPLRNVDGGDKEEVSSYDAGRDFFGTADVWACADAERVAAARMTWARMNKKERARDADHFLEFDEGEEPRPDFFHDLAPEGTPPLVILPGDMRLTVRWQGCLENGDFLGVGTAYLLRRVAPAHAPRVAPPSAPHPSFEAYREYRSGGDGYERA